MQNTNSFTLKDLQKIASRIKRQTTDKIYCHPCNVHFLKESLPRSMFDRSFCDHTSRINTPGGYFNYDIVTDLNLPIFIQKWIPPKGPFWECEENDKDWCLKVGGQFSGTWIDSSDRAFFTFAPRSYLTSKPLLKNEEIITKDIPYQTTFLSFTNLF